LNAAETNVVLAPPMPPLVPAKTAEESLESQRILRSYLQLQEQLHATLLAIEQARAESTAASRSNAELLTARLEFIEKALQQQQEQQRESMQQSNRTMLVLAGIFVGVGFLTLLFMALFQLRGMNRLAEIATGLPAGRMLGAGAVPNSLEGGDSRLLGATAEAAGSRLQNVVERMEQRIGDLETTAHSPATTGGNGSGSARSEFGPVDPQLSALLGRGESLLKLGQSADALHCFEEALARAPHCAEAHVKRGIALEQLKRTDAAIEAYDRAIAIDRSITLAYLRKGSLFNQQEKFGEALDCYEQALRVESRQPVSST
jgi:tetratricopeptide (TPR) repeat protein